MSKDKLNRYERAFRYVRNIAQPHCEDYTDFCLRTDVLVEAIQKAEKYDELQKLLTEYNVTDENIRQILLGGNQVKELVDKATPQTVIPKWKEGYDPELYSPYALYCPRCNRKLRLDQFYKWCPDCNQKLNRYVSKWELENE